MTDTDALILYARHQDAEAFRQIVLRHQNPVFSACHRILRNAADAEEATQETFLKLARNAGKIRQNLAGWLHSSAVRTALDLRRSRLSRSAREENWATLNSDIADKTEFHHLTDVLDECLLELSDDDRSLIIALYLENNTQDETARSLGISASGVRKRLDKAIDLLRSRMAKKGVALSAAILAANLTQVSAQASPVPSTLTASLTKIGVAGVGKTSTITIGGLIMGKTTAIVTASVVSAALLTGATIAVIKTKAKDPEKDLIYENESLPIIREVEVQYAGEARVSKKDILKLMQSQVGERLYPYRVLKDTRNLYATGKFENLRLYDESAKDGVKLIVIVQCK